MTTRFKKELIGVTILAVVAAAIRLTNWEKSFMWGHDHDLYSWIVKDILVNHHQRLVGQVTSVDGVFIGSLYYYLMAVGYWISGMEAWGAVIITLAISLFGLLSMWWVARTTIGPKAGWIGAIIWTLSWGIASYEKWSVPTMPVLVWTVWFWWAAVKMINNNIKGWVVYGILTGLVWHIHIGLLPLLPVPVAVAVVNMLRNKKRRFDIKKAALVLGLMAVVNLPLGLFEVKTSFSQMRAMAAATKIDKGGPTGMQKVDKVMEASGKEIQMRLFAGWESKYWKYWLVLGIMGLVVLRISKRIGWSETGIYVLATGLVLAAQFSSKRVVSEYYFTSLAVLVLFGLVRVLNSLNGRLVVLLLTIFGLSNLAVMVKNNDVSNSLYYHNKVVEYIEADMNSRGFECMAINFITTPGNNVGFRYLFWQKGVWQVKAANGNFPVYNIVNPWLITDKENDVKIGRFGVIKPKDESDYQFGKCREKEFEVDPLLGYVD